jgi:hypothetical protein
MLVVLLLGAGLLGFGLLYGLACSWKIVRRLGYPCSFPFKGKVGMGMGFYAWLKPIPTLTLPLKGREHEG